MLKKVWLRRENIQFMYHNGQRVVALLIVVCLYLSATHIMQRRIDSVLPGESVPIPLGAMPFGSRGAPHQRAPTTQQRAAVQKTAQQGQSASAIAIARERAAGNTRTNLDGYFAEVLSQFKDDSDVINPLGMNPRDFAMPSSSAAPQEATPPVGNSAIEDVRVFFDTLIQPQAFGGYPRGEIPAQFAQFRGMSPPDNLIMITVSPFTFPHIYTPDYPAYDFFYFRTVFMFVRLIPNAGQVQSTVPNGLFSFEMAVDDIDSSAVYLRPLEPSFILNSPINSAGDLSVQFAVRSPIGLGFVNCPIPPIRMLVRRAAALPLITRFYLTPPDFIGALAPVGSPAIVQIAFQKSTPGPVTPLEALLLSRPMFSASNFVAVAGPPPFVPTFSFDINVDSTALLPVLAEEIFIFIPKNSIAFTMRLSCLKTTKTNGFVPIHN